MKKRLTVHAFTISASLFLATGIFAQSFNTIKFNETAASESKAKSVKVSADKHALGVIKNYSEKTFKNFTKTFPSASNLKIRTVKKDMHITGSSGDSVIRALYNRNGRSLYSVVSYPSSQLPESIVERVERFFAGYTVYGPVTDVTVNFKTAHLILIENKRTWKRVRMINDEMDVYEEYTKDL